MRLSVSTAVLSLLAASCSRVARSTAISSTNSSTAAAFISSIATPSFQSNSIGIKKKKSQSNATSIFSTMSSSATQAMIDPQYPGTAMERLQNVHARVRELVETNALVDQPWETIRKKILWAGGLRDLPNAAPGNGYTGHSFNDFNHVDLTCMLDGVSDNENDGKVKGIALGNRLGNGIRVASLPELGPGGSWSTCALGCAKDPPQDVAHIQFQSRIAFKLVWVPQDDYRSFVLVDDSGKLLAHGKPLPGSDLPPIHERQLNYQIVAGSKYAKEADRIMRVATE